MAEETFEAIATFYITRQAHYSCPECGDCYVVDVDSGDEIEGERWSCNECDCNFIVSNG